jgi:hypoxanthine-DNA glycosylase
LAVREYYANPRNAFWPITGELFGFDQAAPYERRLSALQASGVALWDVLRSCRRIGSSDAKIDPKSLLPNDFTTFFARCPAIERVYFNGVKAAQLFRRFVDIEQRIRCQPLPSTSPARAMRPADKLEAWRVITRS